MTNGKEEEEEENSMYIKEEIPCRFSQFAQTLKETNTVKISKVNLNRIRSLVLNHHFGLVFVVYRLIHEFQQHVFFAILYVYK